MRANLLGLQKTGTGVPLILDAVQPMKVAGLLTFESAANNG